MSRVLLCLALCLLFAVLYQQTRPPAEEQAGPAASAESFRPAWLGALAMVPEAGFPSGVPWAGLVELTPAGAAVSDPLPDPDPVAFLEKSLTRYDREVQSYSCTLQKQELVGGTLHKVEVVQAYFKERPFSVFMKWLVIGSSQAKAALYVEGQNDNKLLVRPAGPVLSFFGVVKRSLDAPDVKQSGRYGIHEFGLKKAVERVLVDWYKAQKRQALHVAYEGVYRVKDAGNRLCYKLHRTRYEHPEADGITDLVLYIDVETWLQVGSILRGENGRLIGEYYFRDIRLNPTFTPDQFTQAALKR
jgi:hypothetical protein